MTKALLITFALATGMARPAGNPVEELNARLQSGARQLTVAPTAGYLRSVLDALAVPVQSQIVVFSKTSLMRQIITPQNPRAIYFNDHVAVGWVRGEPFVEVAALDPRQGIVFYLLDQAPAPVPQFYRDNSCRSCHEGFSTHPIPRFNLRSVFSGPDGTPVRTLGDFVPTGATPLRERWGGWYVTGNSGPNPHLGNIIVTGSAKRPPPRASHLDTLTGRFETAAYLTPYSDVVALLVFEHQMNLLNLLTAPAPADDIADALLFVDEVPLAGRITGTSGFTEAFEALGPRDRHGRSLRQFDLRRRLMRYPCSYLIYSPAFDALPTALRDAVYTRLWSILSGAAHDAKYQRLTAADRRAIREILADTKPDLPGYFR